MSANMGLVHEDLDANGEVHMSIPRDRSFRVILRPRNSAANITGGGGLWDRRIVVFSGNNGFERDDNVTLGLDVEDQYVYGLTLFTDARDYIQTVHRHSTREAIVIDGPMSRPSYAPCFSYFGLGTLSFGHGRGWSLAVSLAAIFVDYDISITEDWRSRGIIPHEYGHLVMCDMVYDNSRIDFARAWGEEIAETVSGGGAVTLDRQARIAGEGWADFVAAHVSGGTNYFATSGSHSVLEDPMAYCSRPVPLLSPPNVCLEDNIGPQPTGLPFPDPLWNGFIDEAHREIAQFTSTFADFVDEFGATCRPSYPIWAQYVSNQEMADIHGCPDRPDFEAISIGCVMALHGPWLRDRLALDRRSSGAWRGRS